MNNDSQNFNDLAIAAADRGYNLKLQETREGDIWHVFTTNRVKVEIKFFPKGTEFVMGYGLDKEDLELIHDQLDSELEWTRINSRFMRAKFTDVATFWDIVDKIENLSVQGKTSGHTTQLFSTAYNPVSIAQTYRAVIESKNQVMLNNHRGMLQADSHDKVISVNKKTCKNDYREHIVPCVMIHNKVIEMILQGANDFDVAKLIDDNMKIMHIPTADANRLDGAMGLKTSMPEGWEWGDDPMARIHAL
jgi:hypothetical protein